MKIWSDEGFFFGIGAFETIAVEQGYPVFLEEHYRRLRKAMEFLGIDRSFSEIESEVEKCLEQVDIKSGRRVLKVTVSPENLLVTTRENTYTEADYRRGFSTEISSVRRNETSPFTFHKTLNYGENIMEKRRAKAAGIDEPVFLNMKGELAEGATTNLFLVKNGKLVTPPVESGILPGILRQYICGRYEVEERPVKCGEWNECEEMFLTNSLLGIMPVSSLDGKPFRSREISMQLLHEYRDFISK